MPQTGIYKVIHRKHPRQHELLLTVGETFAECTRCGKEVEFQMVMTAPLITEDEDFR